MKNDKELYSISDMIEKAVSEYKLEFPEANRGIYYTEISRQIKRLGLWDDALTELRGKSKTRVFTYNQMQTIFSSKHLYNYFRKHSIDEEIQKSKSYDDMMEQVEIRRESAIAFLSQQGEPYDDSIPTISNNDFLLRKLFIMVEALFNEKFTEFNSDLFYSDLYSELTKDELNLTPDILDAENRIRHPEKFYYSKRTGDKE